MDETLNITEEPTDQYSFVSTGNHGHPWATMGIGQMGGEALLVKCGQATPVENF